MKATYRNHMGDDLEVVNVARVSFAKESTWAAEATCVADCAEHGFLASEDCPVCDKDYTLSAGDTKLIKYLAREGHTSPFRHCFASFHVKAPIFVVRQLGKHQVGMSWNEVSRRYVDSEPEFYWPDEWREKAENKKQGSGDGVVTHFEKVFIWDQSVEEFSPDDTVTDAVEYAVDHLTTLYEAMLEANIAPEQARMILPQNMYTEVIWTGSLQAWAHMCNQRCAPDTQDESREIANQISEIMGNLYPVSWKALRHDAN
jgi:thymidylate synthase (FAD)